MSDRRVGLARALSKLGHCSRSQGFELARAGRVRLNGVVCRDPEAPVRMDRDRLEVDGEKLAAQAKVYLMLNKPRGIVTTASDEKGRDTVYALLDPALPWVAPVGRLDKASEGLLLMTNDPEWAARLLAPSTHVAKTYHVQISALADAALLASMRRGVEVDGERLAARSARVLRTGEKNCWLEVILDEGKNRQIRRMLEALGVEVLRLLRVAVGPLALGELPKGKVQPLSAAQKSALDRAMRLRSVEGENK